jgi:hypothetical protein
MVSDSYRIDWLNDFVSSGDRLCDAVVFLAQPESW